ncbi:MAG: PAS domain S-box protein, partial [Bacteroidetes bacterium]
MSSISSPVLKREIPRYLFIIFPLVVLSIVAMGYYYYLEEKETVIQNASRNLSTVADLKVNQIIQWRRERLSDANFIFTNENIARRITRLNQVPFPSLDFKQTHVWMSAMFNNGHYERMMLLDSSREKLIVLPPGNFSINPYLNVLLDSVRLTKKVLFSDIHLGVESLPELDLLVPILSEQDSSMVGTIILEVNPENFLYPILQSWPSASPTSETFLLRREGNAVLLLNQLRYLHQPPLTNSKPLTEFSLPAVHAVLGYQEIFEGTDYRGKQVLAATRIIPNSPWYLVTKTDREEIFEPLQKEFSLIALIELTLILFAGSLLGFIWRHNRAQLFRTLYEKETEKLALAKHYEYLTKHANDCIILYDDDDHIIEANERACETYQYTREEFLQKKLIELRDPETLPDFRQQLNKVKSENGNIFETSHIRKDGTTFPVEVSARPITINDSLFIQSIIRDISERKKTEEKIRKLNRLYATLSEINQTIVRVNDLEKLFPAICQIAVDYGKFRMAWLGKIDRETQIVKPVASAGTSDSYLDSIDISIMDIPTGKCPTGAAVRERRCIYTNDILNDPRMEPWRKEALQHGYRSSAAIPILDKGDIDYVFNFYAPEPNFFDWDELHLLEEIGTDISFAIERFRSKERQQRTEEALRTSEKKFKELFDNAPIGYHELDVHGNIVNINQTELEMLGYTREETVGKPVWEFIYDKESAHARVLAKLAGKLSSDTNTERAFVRSDGIIVSVLSDERILINEQGAITGLRTVIQDITTQKQTQLALRDSEERYRGLFEHMTEGYAYCKMLFEDGKAIDWIYVSVNDAFEKLTGLKNVMGKRVAEVIPGIHELDPELFNIYERVALNGKPEKFEIFVEVLKMWFSISVYSPEREFFVAVFDVITERKAAEEAMRTSEERYRLISNVASDYMFSTHLINENELKLEWVAGAFETLTGYTLAEYIAHGGWRACLHPDDIEVDNRDMKQLRENKKAVTEVRTIKKDGSILWVQVSAHPVWDETRNRLTGIYGAVKDITERKAAEEAMRESEERLRLALDAAEQGLYDLNVQTGEAKVNPQYASMLGYDPETFVETNQKWIERLHPDDREPVAAAYSAYINGELPEYKVEFRQRTNNGEWKWILSLGKIVQYDRDGKPLRMLGTHTDITERKIAEQLLKESERRYRDIFTFAPLGVYQATRDGKFIAVNARLVEILGYDSMDELKKVNLGQDVYYDPDEREQLIVKYEPVGYVPGIPVCWKKKNMTPVWISLTAHAVKDKLGKTLYFEGFIQDITERRLAEQSLRESEERYRLLVNTSPDPIFLHQEGQFIFVNPAGVKLLGAVTQEDLIGKPILDVIHPTYRNIVTERIQTASSEKKRVPVIEEKFLRLDGGVIDVEVSATGL